MVLSDCLDEQEYFTVGSDQKNEHHQIIGPHNDPIGKDNFPQSENVVSSCLDMQWEVAYNNVIVHTRN